MTGFDPDRPRLRGLLSAAYLAGRKAGWPSATSTAA